MTHERPKNNRRDFLFRFAVLGLAHILAGAAGFAVMIVVSRWFGVEALGVVVLATSMLAYGTVVATLGVETHAVVEVAARRAEARQLVSDVFVVRLAASLVVHILIVTIAAFLPAARGQLGVFFVYGLVLYPFALRSSWVYQAWGQTHAVAAVELVLQAAALTLTLALAWFWPNLIGVAFARVGAECLVTAVLLWNLLDQIDSLPRPSPLGALANMVRESIHLSGIQLARGLAFASDAVILGSLSAHVTTAQLGQYGAAFRIFTASIVLVNAYFVLLLPKVAAAVPQGWPRVRSLTLAGSALFAAISCLGVVPIALFSNQIAVALFGNRLVETGPILRVLMVAYPFVAMRQHGRAALLATKRRRFDFWLAVGGTTLHVLLKILAATYLGYASLAWVWVGIESLSVAALFGYLVTSPGEIKTPAKDPGERRQRRNSLAPRAATSDATSELN